MRSLLLMNILFIVSCSMGLDSTRSITSEGKDQIFVRGTDFKTRIININLKESSANELYNILGNSFHIDKNQMFILNGNKILQHSNYSLHNSGITTMSNLEVSCRILGGGNKPGLSILLKCKKCNICNWHYLGGVGSYYMIEQIHKCKGCNKEMGIYKIGLNNCEYTIRGLANKYGEKSQKGDVDENGAYLDITGIKWTYLNIYINKINQSSQDKFFDTIIEAVTKSNESKNSRPIIIINNSFNNTDSSVKINYNNSFNTTSNNTYTKEDVDNSFALNLAPNCLIM